MKLTIPFALRSDGWANISGFFDAFQVDKRRPRVEIDMEETDLPGCFSCADDTETAFRRAREAMGLHLYGMEEDGDPIPEPTPIQNLHPEPGANVIPSLVDAHMPVIRAKVKKATTKKTLTIPAWLNVQAEQAGINFSQVLQEGLKQKLGVQ